MTTVSSNITSAMSQWSSRPAEERYRSIPEMQVALQARKEASAETIPLDINEMEAVPVDGDLVLASDKNAAILSHYSTGQIASSIKAPADYLRRLPVELAAACVTDGLRKNSDKKRSMLIQGSDKGTICRAVTSEQYSRYWDADVCTDLLNTLSADGWRVPPARPYPNCPSSDTWVATASDVLPNSTHALAVKVGDVCGPAGLYASDKDMFVLMVNQDRAITTPSGPMYRALILKNSEVGAASYNVECILYNEICGNHILWSAQSIANVRVVHRGSNNSKRITGRAYLAAAIEAAESVGAIEEENRIAQAAETEITEEQVIKKTGLPAQRVRQGKIVAELNPQDHGGRDGTVWGYVQGLTRASQESGYMADRSDIDKAAAKLMQAVA